MTSVEIATDILRLYSRGRSLPVEDLYTSFATVDRNHVDEVIYDLVENRLLQGVVTRSDLLDGRIFIVSSITRTTIVGERWLAQLDADAPTRRLH